jgi:hypothetical protein
VPSLFEDQFSPHVFLIDFKLGACHLFVLLVHALAAIYEGEPAICNVLKTH